MKVHLAGNDGYHRDPMFLLQVILSNSAMKIYLVNTSTTAGG